MSADEKVLVSQGFAAWQAFVIANLPAVEAVEAQVAKREAAITVETVKPGKR